MVSVIIAATLLVALGTVCGPNTLLHYIALAVDYAGAIIFLRRFDMTISTVAGIEAGKGKKWAITLRAILNRIQPNHCAIAIQADRERLRAALEYLGQ